MISGGTDVKEGYEGKVKGRKSFDRRLLSLPKTVLTEG